MDKKSYAKTSYSRLKIIKAAAALLAAVAISVSAVFAWFANNKDVSADYLKLTVDSEQVILGDIVVTRSLYDGEWVERLKERYGRESNDDNVFYKYVTSETDGVTQILDKNSPLSINEILPGERISLDICYKSTGTKFNAYQIYLSDFDADTFTDGKNNDRSVLGMFQYGYDSAETEDKWMVEYLEGGGETVPDKIVVKSGSYQTEAAQAEDSDGYVHTVIRITVNLSQCYNRDYLGTIPSNFLSEKKFSIGTLGIAGC